MSVSIRVKVMGGTDIKTAYLDCGKVSASLGGISVETDFNGVEMFYYHQSLDKWKDEYRKGVFGPSKEGAQSETGIHNL